jgi:hypothetical protein
LPAAGSQVTIEELLETLVGRLDVLIGELTGRRESSYARSQARH